MARFLFPLHCAALLLPSTMLRAADVDRTSPWVLAFQDDFDGDSLDAKKWSKGYAWGATHNHRAYMAPEQVRIQDGKLVLEAVAKRHPSAPAGTDKYADQFGYLSFDYTSGAVHTNGKFNFTFGKAVARCRIPSTLGTWPAFWTLNADGAWPPEIDILEVPKERTVHHYYYHHGSDWQHEASFGGTHTGPDKSLAFHEYGVEWTANSMRFLFDGQSIAYNGNRTETTQGKDMYLILNLAVGGWAGDPPAGAAFPARFECDWVKVWKANPDCDPDQSNWDLETGALAPWGQWNSVAVATAAAHGGKWGLRLSGSPASSERRVKVRPSTNYVFSGWGRLGAAGSAAMVGVKNYGGQQKTTSFTSTSWEEKSVTFTTGATDTVATLFFYLSSGTGVADGDDFRLVESGTRVRDRSASPAAASLQLVRDGSAFEVRSASPLREVRLVSPDGVSLPVAVDGCRARLETPSGGVWFVGARDEAGHEMARAVVSPR